MPTLTLIADSNTWPATPTQRFFDKYKHVVDAGELRQETMNRYYSEKVIFHNTNGVTHYGTNQLWAWTKDLFAPFEKFYHPLISAVEIALADGNVMLDMQMERWIWMKGNTSAEPDVKVPMFWKGICGPAAEEGQGTDGLQMKELWLYWDTGPLTKCMSEHAEQQSGR